MIRCSGSPQHGRGQVHPAVLTRGCLIPGGREPCRPGAPRGNSLRAGSAPWRARR